MGSIEIKGFLCERCGHKWVSRVNSSHLPIVCSKCKSPYWNIPKKKKGLLKRVGPAKGGHWEVLNENT